jgi:hypothetical protein
MNNIINIPAATAELRRLTSGIRFDVADHAPSTLQAVVKHYNQTGRLVVWSGESDRTIWGSAENNYMFRAWHDSLHLQHLFPFTLQGESRVAELQANSVNSELGKIVLAEVIGQAAHFERYGHFPIDQIEFVRQYLLTNKE